LPFLLKKQPILRFPRLTVAFDLKKTKNSNYIEAKATGKNIFKNRLPFLLQKQRILRFSRSSVAFDLKKTKKSNYMETATGKIDLTKIGCFFYQNELKKCPLIRSRRLS
jgi:hypothetical protein